MGLELPLVFVNIGSKKKCQMFPSLGTGMRCQKQPRKRVRDEQQMGLRLLPDRMG
jgi:hypothetical protein